MNRAITLFLVVVFVACAVAAQSPISPPKFIEVEIPGSSATNVTGINNQGVMVGSYANPLVHGFAIIGSKMVEIDFPGANGTGCTAINSGNAIVGYADYLPGQPTRGFLYQNGNFTDIGPPGGDAWAFGINDSGIIVGEYIASDRSEHGFVYDGATYVTLDVPGGEETAATGINNQGLIVLTYASSSDNRNHVAIYDGSSYTTIDVPGATDSFSSGINSSGDVVYTWYDAQGISHGALLHAGQYFKFMVPGSNQTVAAGINDQDTVVGLYYDHRLKFTPGYKLIP